MLRVLLRTRGKATQMSEQTGATPTDSPDSKDSPWDRAAAAGPIPWVDASDDDAATANAEPAIAHDSPAGVEEERAADPDAPGDELAGPDRLTSIYGPPPGDRE
jgi:hypothetical protein